MCGRFTLRRLDFTREEFDLLKTPSFEEFDEKQVVPRFNICPSQQVAAIRTDAQGERSLGLVAWGLVPSWSSPDAKTKPINARAETVAKSGMFRHAFDRRRCIIPADGFFEWQGKKPPKQPFFIHRTDDGVFGFAGLWERWRAEKDGPALDTCTIVTTEPNDVMRPIHNRMPVILHRDDYARWLDRDVPGKDVADLLSPFDGPLEAYHVATLVNRPGNEGAKLIERTG